MTDSARDRRTYLAGGASTSSTLLVVHDKYSGEPAYEVPVATPEDVRNAVAAATEALAHPLPAHERYDVLMRVAAEVEEDADTYVAALVAEGGKPLKASRAEVARSVETLRWSAEEAKRLTGEFIPLDASPIGVGRYAVTLREPVGVVAAITPTNSPLNLVAHKVGPAIAAGNTVVLKPPQATPVCSMLLRDAFARCGLPAGYLSVVAGPGLGDALQEDDRIDFYNFTGSVEVGAQLRSAVGLRGSLLELGGNSPVIIHKDAAVKDAARACASKAFLAAGQACTSVQRIYVHADVEDVFMEALVEATHGMVVGDPADESTDVGPMISRREAERVTALIQSAVEDGAELVVGGRHEGATVWPTILRNVPHSHEAYCGEIFGPAVVVETYTDVLQAADAANDTPFGLHSAVFTRSLRVAFEVGKRLRTGGVMVNEASQWRTEFMPFGGVKSSGIGREGPKYAVQEMTVMKVIALAFPDDGDEVL